MATQFKSLIIPLSLAAVFAAPAVHRGNRQDGIHRSAVRAVRAGRQNQLKSWQYIAEMFKRRQSGRRVKFEIVGFDNKGSPQEVLNALKAAIDQGIRYIIQGNGSGVALALIDAINKYNERNPGKEMVYLN